MSTDQAIHIDSLLQCVDSYPHPVNGSIEFIETHISWVILAGDYAYKIKKPIRNSFLDYTTLELRKQFCEAEVKLNRRFANDLYLGVVAIAENDGRLVIGGPGKPVEYAVKMKRFPVDALFRDRLSNGLVTLSDVRRLATRIADFHQRAARAESASRFGSADLVYQESLDNFREIKATRVARVSETLSALQTWTEEQYVTQLEKFQGRKMGGHIRECHGDLHLGNIVAWNDELIPFDGIEFCDEFRWIDTISDAAFTAMDLAAHGHLDFCRSFINAYVEATGDYGSIEIFHWYLVYRALVRSKVAAIRFSQTESNPQGQSVAENDFLALVALAHQLATASKTRPSLWITHGLSGSGKTTGSEKVVQRHGAIRVRADVERKRLAGFGPYERISKRDECVASLYTDEVTTRTYQRLAELAEALLKAGTNVIVDATFLAKNQRLIFRILAERLRVPFHIVAFHAEPAKLRQRIVDRLAANQDASDADLAVLDSQIERQQPLDDDELKFEVPCTNGS